jgi:mRNA interferase MazF
VRRGELVVVNAPGDYGKPRPAVVVQINLLNDAHDSIGVCLLTSHLLDAPDFRLTVEPGAENGLKTKLQIMIDKVMAIRRDRLGGRIGVLSRDDMVRVNRALAIWVGLAS